MFAVLYVCCYPLQAELLSPAQPIRMRTNLIIIIPHADLRIRELLADTLV